jgi:hypothetical protein
MRTCDCVICGKTSSRTLEWVLFEHWDSHYALTEHTKRMNGIQRTKVLDAARIAAYSGLAILALNGGLLTAQTATVVGYPANFDAVNNTGQETHGFEIEADGISSSDITVSSEAMGGRLTSRA